MDFFILFYSLRCATSLYNLPKFFNGNFVRNKDEIAIKLALGEVFFCRSQLSAQTILQFRLFQALIA